MSEGPGFYGVAAFFKNGKPKRMASVSISYSDPSNERVYDVEPDDFVPLPPELMERKRPWYVSSWPFTQGRSYSGLQHAFAVFLAEVRASDPKDPKRS